MSVWTSLIGQDTVVHQLARAAAEEKPTHAWLFSSPPGAGRQTAALAFAAALLCDQPNPADRGCGSCKSCTTVLAGTHADLTNFTTENLTIKIEEARELINKAQDRPSVGRWRIMLINDADRMPERTSNVLLKAIEEPPPHTIWLLTTPSPQDVLVTIRSRCRPVKLATPTPAKVEEALLAQGTAPNLAGHIAALSQGNLQLAHYLAGSPAALERRQVIARMPLRISSIQDAMEAAHQLISIAEAEAEADATARNERDRQKLLDSLGADDEEKMTPTVRAHLRRLEEDQKRRAKRIQTDTLDRFLVDIQSVLRDLLSLQIRSGAPLINQHLAQDLAHQAEKRSTQQTLAHLDALAETRKRIQTNAAARLALEALMASFV